MSADQRVVTFYSFKGGAGRTVCAANMAHFLANERNAGPDSPVLLIDMDLDSAGLTIMLDQSETFGGKDCNATRIATGDFDLGETRNAERLFSEGLVDISEATGARPGTVLFLGAEVMSREEFILVTSRSGDRMRDLLDLCNGHGISTILIDSASGRQETAQICHGISNVIVYCCRLTNQFIVGTKAHLFRFMGQCREKDGNAPGIIIYPVAVPEVEDHWKPLYQAALTTLKGLCNDIEGDGLTKALVVEPGLGEVESFKWSESVLVRKQNLQSDEQNALNSYLGLANRITEFLQ